MYADVSPRYTPFSPPAATDLTQVGQTFEGGISARPDAEAHGAYAFCALGCLAILDAPHRIIPRYAASACLSTEGVTTKTDVSDPT